MVDKRLFDAYADAMGVNAELVHAATKELVRSLGGVPAEGLADALRDGYAALVSTYGDLAAAIAVEFYRRQRAAGGVTVPYDPEAFPADNVNLLPWDVQHALQSGDVAGSLGGSVVQRVMEYGDATLIANARRDPAHPKWALVPHAGACGWCRLMGSRGFSYASERTARDVRHPNCRCSVAVDFDASDPALEGYDPDALGDEYIEARDAVEDAAREEWAAMDADARAEFRRTHNVKGRSDYDVFLRNKMIGHMNRR